MRAEIRSNLALSVLHNSLDKDWGVTAKFWHGSFQFAP
jgi:hypothetical protein